MTTKRVLVNLAAFLAVTTGLTLLGINQLLMPSRGENRITADFTDTGGLSARNDVTLRGVTVGSVDRVELTERAVRAHLQLERGIEIPEGTTAAIVRRSPIGDLVVELTPGDGEDVADGGHIDISKTTPPADAGRTVEALADFLHSVPSEDIATVVSELAKAVKGRGADLAALSEATADLPARILEVRGELEALINTGPTVTGVLAENANALADDLTRTAQLADILRDRRYDLVHLYRNGARFTTVAGRIIARDKANIACLVSDFGDINSVLAEPRHRDNLASALDLNHFFFEGVEQAVQKGLDGHVWFRVQTLPHTEPAAKNYAPQRGEPDVYAANSCRSRYGAGVGPGRQPVPPNLSQESELHKGK